MCQASTTDQPTCLSPRPPLSEPSGIVNIKALLTDFDELATVSHGHPSACVAYVFVEITHLTREDSTCLARHLLVGYPDSAPCRASQPEVPAGVTFHPTSAASLFEALLRPQPRHHRDRDISTQPPP